MSHWDCLQIDFHEGNGNWMKCQMQQTQWVRQPLTASELHWFSLVVPTLTDLCSAWIDSYFARWYASTCGPNLRRWTELMLNCLSLKSPVTSFCILYVADQKVTVSAAFSFLLQIQKASWEVLLWKGFLPSRQSLSRHLSSLDQACWLLIMSHG